MLLWLNDHRHQIGPIRISMKVDPLPGSARIAPFLQFDPLGPGIYKLPGKVGSVPFVPMALPLVPTDLPEMEDKERNCSKGPHSRTRVPTFAFSNLQS